MARGTGVRGFLTRLRKDVRGNALAIMGAAIIPLAGLVGGGIDMARVYIVKTRLQHACDAGALAGRKAMGGGLWSQSSYMPRTSANEFFTGNFIAGSYGSQNLAYGFTENAGKVTGTASADVPLTLMRIFGLTKSTVAVACDADMRLPNTDVMFVLDNTGSMGETLPGDTQTKITALKTAVKCFYEIVAKLDTDANCTTGTPSGGLGGQVQVRFGFVPYDMNVNVGYLLKPEWFANSWPYQSREPTTIYGKVTSTSDGTKSALSSNSNKTATTATLSDCQKLADSFDASASNGTLSLAKNEGNGGINGGSGTWQATQAWKDTMGTYDSWTSKTNGCKYHLNTQTYTRTYSYAQTTNSDPAAVPFTAWWYHQRTIDISGLKNGTSWNTAMQANVGSSYTTGNYTWDGCIEERKTVAQATYDPIDPTKTRDLDIDGIPSQSDPDSLWGPVMNDFIFARRASFDSSSSAANLSQNEIKAFQWSSGSTSYGNFTGNFQYDCPAVAHKMETWNDPDVFDTYVDTLKPGGNTYHDIGLLWGARLMSPTGLFASENAYTPQGGEIQRNMIFMTDGDACTDNLNYQAYGVAWYDQRQGPTWPATSDEGCASTSGGHGPVTEQVIQRTNALCTAIKNKNITLWVVYFGSTTSATGKQIAAQMTACASPSRFFAATNAATLQTTFANIANQISQLRLTR